MVMAASRGSLDRLLEHVEFEQLRFTIDRIERQRIRQVTLHSQQPLSGRNGEVGSARESAG